MRTLLDLKPGQSGRVQDFQGQPALLQRLFEMGLTEGEEVHFLRSAPLGDPIEVRVRGYNLSLRRSEAASVVLEPGT